MSQSQSQQQQQSQTFISNFQRCIAQEDYYGLLRLYFKYPTVRGVRTTNNMTPIDYTLSKYHTNCTPQQLRIIGKVIDHSNREDLNEIDFGGDTILSRIYNYDEDTIYRLIHKLSHKGYNFDRTDVRTNDLCLYLSICYQDKHDIDERIVNFLLISHTSSETLTHYKDQFMDTILYLSYKDMDHVLKELKKKHFPFPTYLPELWLLIRTSKKYELKEKLDRLLKEMKLDPTNTLSIACREDMTFRFFQHLLERIGRQVKQEDLNKALLIEVKKFAPSSDDPLTSPTQREERRRIIEELCKHGADTTYKDNDTNKDSIYYAGSSHNLALLRTLVPYTSTKRLRRALRQEFILLDNVLGIDIIKENLNFRETMSNVKKSFNAQQRSLRSVRSRTLPPQQEFVASLPIQLRRQLESMVSPRQAHRS